MSAQITVSKNALEQTAIPDQWRQTLASIVEALGEGNTELRGLPNVRPVSSEEASRIAENLQSYGAQLINLPDSVWETSVCQWTRAYWDVLVDLHTLEEGASDLVLAVRVFEVANGYEFSVQSVHVP